MDRRDFMLAAGSTLAGGLLAPNMVFAQRSGDAIVAVTEMGPNMLDTHPVGSNRAAYATSWLIYDRLITFGVRKLPSGAEAYDYFNLRPEAAESFQVAPDNKSVTFRLRKDIRFHDGAQMTARDVKWSYDRFIGAGGFPQRQMEQGSLTDPKQFVVVDDYTFRVDFLREDRLTMPSLAIVVPAIYNSELCKKHATAADPWALEWTKTNAAGSGAYRVEQFKPNDTVQLIRNTDWKAGPVPKANRVLIRVVPAAGTRRALIERGDADVSMDLPPRDYKDLADGGKIPVHSVPMYNTVKHLALLTTAPPFNDVRVRRAIAYAIPYQQIIDSALFGRARALHGAGADAPKEITWPTPFPYNTDTNRAKALLAEAGLANGFETSIAFDAQMATVDEPVALIIQDALSKIGIKVTVNKVPDFPARRNQKAWPMAIDLFGAWFDDPDFYFRWIYHGQNTVWNLGGYKNEKMDQLLNAARNERQGPQYTALARQFIRLAMDDVPVIPLYQPVLDVAVQKNVGGYRYMFFRNPDFRTLTKS